MVPLAKKKNKPEEEWLTTGNAFLDSSIHFLGTTDQAPLIFKTNNVERMRISSNGYVGIGTPVPVHPFHVEAPTFIRDQVSEHLHVIHHLSVGPLRISQGIGCITDTVCTGVTRDLWLQGRVMQWRADTVKVGPQVGGLTAQVEILGQLTTQDLFLKSDSVEAGALLTVDSMGKVVGITDPWKLVANPSGGSVCPSPKSLIALNWRNPFGYGPSWKEKVFLMPMTGVVGIGICDPRAKVHIKSPQPIIQPLLLVEGEDSDYPFGDFYGLMVNDFGQVGVWQDSIAVNYPYSGLVLDVRGVARFCALDNTKRFIRVGYDAGSGVIDFFSDNPKEILRVNFHSGRGISLGNNNTFVTVLGRLVVGQPLLVQSGINYRLVVDGWMRSTGNAYINGLEMGFDGSNGYIEYTGVGNLIINYFTQKPITLGGGNTTVSVPGTLVVGNAVGIGTTPSPGYALSVCGNVHCGEVRVDPIGSWCDYVFAPDYQLMPWDSLMNYVRSHKHLPNVPSADEVATYGVEVGYMLKILLEKIEEQYLYIDALYKRVEYLEQRNRELEEAISQRLGKNKK